MNRPVPRGSEARGAAGNHDAVDGLSRSSGRHRRFCWHPEADILRLRRLSGTPAGGWQGMTMQDYVESLRDKHAFLEQQIDAEMHRPLPDQLLLSRLKREKLKIKDEMARVGNGGSGAMRPNAGLH